LLVLAKINLSEKPNYLQSLCQDGIYLSKIGINTFLKLI